MNALSRALAVWAIGTALACAVVHDVFRLNAEERSPGVVVASVWSAGKLATRAVLAKEGEANAVLDAALASHPGSTLVYEKVVGDGPVIVSPEAALAVSFVPGRDGIAATLDGRTEYVTPDDLLARQAYDKGVTFSSLALTMGVDVPVMLAMLSDRLGVSARDILDRGRLRRVRVVRSLPGAPPTHVVTPDTLTRDAAREAAIAAGLYLARGVDGQGRFRYLVDAPTNHALGGYDWPRHAGATFFLAQIAEVSKDPQVAWAALRAASWLRDHAMVDCGEHRCIGDDRVVDVGSAALTTIAFVEIARTQLDAGYALLVPQLTAFLRSQQRPDGDFMHQYDRDARRPIDIQLLYYTGEAALALSRANSLLGDPQDLSSAARALARLTGPGWSFFGSRYYFGEEHWTCQAMDELWDRAPNREALDFCLRWQAFGRKLQYGPGETPFDADGAYGFGPMVTPRLTPAASRSEAGIATLHAAIRAGAPPSELALLDQQMRRGLALLVRHQLRPGPRHLFADPAAVEGAIPGSEVDWQLRIDYAQHTGSALLRWVNLDRR